MIQLARCLCDCEILSRNITSKAYTKYIEDSSDIDYNWKNHYSPDTRTRSDDVKSNEASLRQVFARSEKCSYTDGTRELFAPDIK